MATRIKVLFDVLMCAVIGYCACQLLFKLDGLASVLRGLARQ